MLGFQLRKGEARRWLLTSRPSPASKTGGNSWKERSDYLRGIAVLTNRRHHKQPLVSLKISAPSHATSYSTSTALSSKQFSYLYISVWFSFQNGRHFALILLSDTPVVLVTSCSSSGLYNSVTHTFLSYFSFKMADISQKIPVPPSTPQIVSVTSCSSSGVRVSYLFVSSTSI